MTPKAWHHSSLAVNDMDAASRFYQAAFGYEVMFEKRGMSDQIAGITGIPGLTCDLTQLRSPVTEHVLELIHFTGPEAAFPDHERAPLRPGMAHVAVIVDDLAATLAHLEALGAVRLGEVTPFERCIAAYCREPGGSFVEIEELTPAES